MRVTSVISAARLSAVLLVASCASAKVDIPAATEFENAYPLAPLEGVFAYSRISPDGRFLAYASEHQDVGYTRVIKVVDLETRTVIFTEPGIDPYFSNDGNRMIYLSHKGGSPAVAIRHTESGGVTRDVAPPMLGDYFSWAVRGGRNLILTIYNNYFYLEGDMGLMPDSQVTSCPGFGTGDRPLISKDGGRISTFVRGTVVVRGLDNCDDVIDTGLEGAKSDFSFDGRYLAMHAPKVSGAGYDILVVDLHDRTVRTITARLRGSSLFPSWTADGRLSFRHDGDDFKGFMFASNFLREPARPLPTGGRRVTDLPRNWADIFPETEKPAARVSVVMVWGTWSAHVPDALGDLQKAQLFFRARGKDVAFFNATDAASAEPDIESLLYRYHITVPRIPLANERLRLTEMHNQNPTVLLFRDGRLLDRRFGAQTMEDLVPWITAALNP
jgi:hypothetical protein